MSSIKMRTYLDMLNEQNKIFGEQVSDTIASREAHLEKSKAERRAKSATAIAAKKSEKK